MLDYESTVEKQLVTGIRKLGGWCLKFISPSMNGVPDRIVFLPGGRIVFVELKRSASAPVAAMQKEVSGHLKLLGHEVHFLTSEDAVKKFLHELEAL